MVRIIRSLGRGCVCALSFGLGAAALSGDALAQPFAGVDTSDILTLAGGGPTAGSYSGPHSGVCPVLTVGGDGLTAANDQRGVVLDGGDDAFDGFGFISVSGGAGDRLIVRNVETNPVGGDAAFRWADTIYNTSGAFMNFTVRFGGDFGSDGSTLLEASGAGFRVTSDTSPFSDPIVGLAFGSAGFPQPVVSTYTGQQAAVGEGVVLTYNVDLYPGQRVTLIHVAFLGTQAAGGVTYCSTRCAALAASLGYKDPMIAGVKCVSDGPPWNFNIPTYHARIAQGDFYLNPTGANFGINFLGGIAGTGGADLSGVAADGNNDGFDNFGLLTVSGTAAQRTIIRDARHRTAGCESAYRWIDRITNISAVTQTFNVTFFGNLGSDGGTTVCTSAGTRRVSFQAGGGDPPVAFVWGASGSAVSGIPTFVADNVNVAYQLTLGPGQSATLVHFVIFGAPLAANQATALVYADLRSEMLVNADWSDPLFQGVSPASNVVNWPSPSSMLCPGDINGDFMVDATDIFVYLDIWFMNNGMSCP